MLHHAYICKSPDILQNTIRCMPLINHVNQTCSFHTFPPIYNEVNLPQPNHISIEDAITNSSKVTHSADRYPYLSQLTEFGMNQEGNSPLSYHP